MQFLKLAFAFTLYISGARSNKVSKRNLKAKAIKAKAKSKSKSDGICRPERFACPQDTFYFEHPAHQFGGMVAIANRGAGSFSLVKPNTLETVVEEVLPEGGQPMYFGFSPQKNEIWVGDRTNNRNAIYRMVGCELQYDGFVENSAGVFHSIITQDSEGKYPIIGTVADEDNVVDIHDLTTRRLLEKLERPQQAIDAGAKPHDLTIDSDHIYVTFLGDTNAVIGFVSSYSATTYQLVSTIETKKDPHVSTRERSQYLFIAAQGGDVLTVTKPGLAVVNTINLPSPHGMFLSYSNANLFITNISEEGAMAVKTIDPQTGGLKICPDVMTSNITPHNPTLSLDEKYLYITHSGGASTANSRFSVDSSGCLDPTSEVVFNTNTNPFGIAVVPEATSIVSCINQH